MTSPRTVSPRSTTGARGAPSAIGVLALILGAFALVAGACGSDDATASSGDTQSTDAQASLDGTDSEGSLDSADGEAEGTSEGVEMIDVATGEKVDLQEALTPDGKPLLAWFWAPFCPTCRGEAPELDSYISENSDRVDLVGVGTRNDIEYAEDFLSDTGVSNFALLWEPTGQSWVDNAVAAQPYMILIDANGEEVQRWPGGASAVQIDNALETL